MEEKMRKLLMVLVAVLVSAGLGAVASAHMWGGSYSGPRGYGWSGGMGPGWMWGGPGIWMVVGMLFWVLLIVGVFLLVIWAVKRFTTAGTGKVGESALDILNKRYARGEIGREEYEEKKKAIS
jgi:putative membrane protein